MSVAAQVHRLQRQFRVRLDDPHYIANSRIGVETQNQVGSRQVEEMHPVRLYVLTHVQQFAQQLGRSRQFHTSDAVARLRCGQMMAYRANTADALSDFRHLKVWATFAEFLQTAEFIHVEERLFHLALFI